MALYVRRRVRDGELVDIAAADACDCFDVQGAERAWFMDRHGVDTTHARLRVPTSEGAAR